MRLIDADALINDLKNDIFNDEADKKAVLEAINEQPTVEQKHGHWIEIDKDVMGLKRYECSNCGKTDDDYSEPIFCKHCGCANGRTGKMDEVTE